MKWLIKEGAIQFEDTKEIMMTVKILYELFDLAKEVKDNAEQTNTDDSLPQPQGTSQPQAVNVQPAAEQAPAMQQAQTETANPVPTAPHAYSKEDLQNAARGLMQAGKQDDLKALLGEFNVAKVSLLADDQLGAFATRLREMGGNI